ncbi:MAG: ATP synthase F1 subunit gamma [Ignavibacteria bacterium RBG_16_34_14]|nr:MAG: ATP synthase F1 subunit gamma [Ignavibacteria bacterium RBG_16_34_14]
MATLRDIKLRIKGVQNTQQITKAMKMVAAAKLRRAQEGILNARPYARKISTMLSHLVTEEDKVENSYIAPREIKNLAVVVVTSDRGLCGAFNTNIIKESVKYIESLRNESLNAVAYCVGKKGYDFFKKRNYDLAGHTTGIFNFLKYEYVLTVSKKLIEMYLDGKVDRVIIIYNEFKSVIQQRIVTEQFLPVPVEKEEGTKVKPNYIYEPDQKSIFNYLLPKHLKAQMWRIFLESNAAELGARMTAMDNATTNAKELIRTLQLTYNKERQAAITKEILEIVSGANALKAQQ